MNREDASFTFLHRIEEVELNIEDGRWQSALALALTLPDICGGIAFPEIVKRYRDGRVMLDRQKKPTRDVGGQFVRWFDEFAAPFFKASASAPSPYICGERCWQLRCEYLHQNKGFLNDEDDHDSVRFHLGINCGTSVCQLEQSSATNGVMDIRIDIEQFCLRMCQAARNYYDSTHQEKDFSLYNTPVLDFIQFTQGQREHQRIVIMCEDSAYASGLKATLDSLSENVLVFHTSASARSTLGKKKPALWVVTEDITRQPDQPWRADKTTPVVLLTHHKTADIPIQKVDGKLTVLTMPVLPKLLRDAVLSHIR